MKSTSSFSAVARHQEIARLLSKGDVKTAEMCCERLTKAFPQFLPGWYSASFIALATGRCADALVAIQRALHGPTPDARIQLQYARCLAAVGSITEARASAGAAMSAAHIDAPLLDEIGSLYSSIGEHDRAVEAYSKAIAWDPKQAAYWFNRAAVRRFVGQLDKAEADYDQAILLQPDDCEAYLNRSELRTQTLARNHIDGLERLLSRTLPWRGEVQIKYALAKEFEDLGRYTEAWRRLEDGARLRRTHLRYEVAQDIDTVQWIIDAFPSAVAGPIECTSHPRPIFIVGLPRSGTTLVERILASHSNVFGAGELNYFAEALTVAARARGGDEPLPRRRMIEVSRQLNSSMLGEDYIRRVRRVMFRQDHFTDKMPLNYLYCALICRALPQARIVHVSRHPIASCYAMFKTLFKDGYPFSYDLGELAQYYIGYRRLMCHWHAIMPGFIHDISYENLVLDQEQETRRLLSACGLEWQDACLNFHANPTATSTASASQVRRPLYETSLRQWRHYEQQLDGLRSQLLAAGLTREELT
jgi:tetratricopeptide (TPR) repeat protein